MIRQLGLSWNEPLFYSDLHFILIAIYIPFIVLQLIVSLSGFLFEVGLELTLRFERDVQKSIKHVIKEQLWKWQLEGHKTVTFLK